MQILVKNITPRALDGIFLSILSCDEVVLEPLFSPISSDPLDPGLVWTIVLLRIKFVQLIQIGRQIRSSVSMVLLATLPCSFLISHNIQIDRLQNSERLPSTYQARTGFRGVNMML